MKKLLALLILSFAAHAQNTGFVEGAKFGVPAGGPSSRMLPAIFFNSYTGDGMAAFPVGQWVDVDVSALVPNDTKAVMLSGLLVITHGSTGQTCDLTGAFRSIGETVDYAYVFQVVDVFVSSGQRSTAATWQALDANRKFQFKWTRSTTGQWPAECSYLMNLRVTAYMR